jgi:uncharacterized protein YqgQ
VADLQKLVVRLEAETARYQRELDAARKKLATFESATKTASSVVGEFKTVLAGVGAGASVNALAQRAKAAMDFADAVDEAASALDVTVGFYQRASFAASLAGINQDKFTASFSKLVQLVDGLASGEEGPAKIFGRLGISAQDAESDMESLFDLVVERIYDLGSQRERLAAIADIFGKKQAAEWAAAFADGAAGFRSLMQEADRFGSVLSDRDISTLGQMGDAIDILGVKLEVAFSEGLARGITGEAGELRDIFTDPGFKAAIDGIAEATRALGFAIGKVGTGLAVIAENRDLLTMIATGAAGARLGSAFGPIGGVIGFGMGAGIGAFDNAARASRGGSQQPMSGGATSTPARPRAPWTPIPFEDTAAGLDQAYKRNEAAILGVSSATLRYQGAIKDLDSLLKAGRITQEQYAKAAEAAQEGAFGTGAEAAKAAAATQRELGEIYGRNEAAILGVDTATLRYRDTLAELDTLVQAGMISQEQYASAAERVFEDSFGMQAEAAADAEAAQRALGDIYAANEAAILGVDAATLQYKDTLGELETLVQAGIISQQQYADAAQRLADEFNGIKSIADFWDENTDRMRQASRGLISDMLVDGENWKDNLLRFFDQVARSFADMAADIATQALFGGQGMGGGGGINWGAIIANLVGGAFGALGGGGAGASNPSAGGGSMILYRRASGGPMPADRPTLVGENGPELVMSRRAMHVLNSRDTEDFISGPRGGGQTVVQNWTFNTPDADSFRASRLQVQRRERMALQLRR